MFSLWMIIVAMHLVRSDDPCLYVSKYGIIDLTTVGRTDGRAAFLNVIPPSGSNYGR